MLWRIKFVRDNISQAEVAIICIAIGSAMSLLIGVAFGSWVTYQLYP